MIFVVQGCVKFRLRHQFSVQAHQNMIYYHILYHALRKTLLDHTKITNLQVSNNRPPFWKMSLPRGIYLSKYGILQSVWWQNFCLDVSPLSSVQFEEQL